MNKRIAIALLLVLLAGTALAQEKFSLVLTGSALMPQDSNFKTIYSKTVFLPEIRLSYALSGDFFLFGGYGLLSASGTTPVFLSEAKSTQHFISAGAGYAGTLGGDWGFEITAGLFLVSYKEAVEDAEATGSAIGFRADAALRYSFSPAFFALAGLGYLTGSDTVDGTAIKLGGLRTGLGIGFKF